MKLRFESQDLIFWNMRITARPPRGNPIEFISAAEMNSALRQNFTL